MEGERVSEAQPEAARPGPAASAAPSLTRDVAVLLARAATPAARRELARRLAPHGNRHVARVLARQPTTAAPPASPIGKGYRAVPIADARWQKVDDLLTWSRRGWEAREVMRTYKVALAEADLPRGTADTSAPAFYDAKGNVCYLNFSKQPDEISAYFVHEMYHASQARTGKSPPADGFPNTEEHRQKWVAMMVEEEVVGTAMGFEHKRVLEWRGMAPRDDRPAGMSAYRRVYELWRDKALAEGKDESAAGAFAREQGLKRVRIMMANPGGRMSPELGPPGGVGESYEDFYAREFRRSPHVPTP